MILVPLLFRFKKLISDLLLDIVREDPGGKSSEKYCLLTRHTQQILKKKLALNSGFIVYYTY